MTDDLSTWLRAMEGDDTQRQWEAATRHIRALRPWLEYAPQIRSLEQLRERYRTGRVMQ